MTQKTKRGIPEGHTALSEMPRFLDRLKPAHADAPVHAGAEGPLGSTSTAFLYRPPVAFVLVLVRAVVRALLVKVMSSDVYKFPCSSHTCILKWYTAVDDNLDRWTRCDVA